MNSPNPTPPDARETLRNLIAENEGKRRNGAASDGRGWFRTEAERMECFAIADAVMELFPEVAFQPGFVVFGGKSTPARYVLRTAPAELPASPQPVEEAPR